MRQPAARLAMRSCRCGLLLLSRAAMLTRPAAGLRVSGGRPCMHDVINQTLLWHLTP